MDNHLKITKSFYLERKWLREEYRAGKYKPISRLEPRYISDEGNLMAFMLGMSLRPKPIKHWRPK